MKRSGWSEILCESKFLTEYLSIHRDFCVMEGGWEGLGSPEKGGKGGSGKDNARHSTEPQGKKIALTSL